MPSQESAFSRRHHVSASQRRTIQRLAAKKTPGEETMFTRRTARSFVSPLTICPGAAGSFALPVHAGHNVNSSIPGSNSDCSALVADATRQLVHFCLRPRQRPTAGAPSSVATPTCVSSSWPSPSPRASSAPPSSLDLLAPGGVTAGSVRRRKKQA